MPNALGIYVIMARDWSDALEFIEACENRTILTDLLEMLRAPPTPKTDVELNGLFEHVVVDRLARFDAASFDPQI